jgi:hypothetical protein
MPFHIIFRHDIAAILLQMALITITTITTFPYIESALNDLRARVAQ